MGSRRPAFTPLIVGARLFLASTVQDWHDCDPVDATGTRQSAHFIEKQQATPKPHHGEDIYDYLRRARVREAGTLLFAKYI